MKARVAEIHPNPYNSRIYYDEDSLKQLANSITKYGLDNPITVREVEGGSYQIAAGHRRLEAIKLLGWDEVDVTVRDLTDDDMLDLTIAENLQREDLTKVEIARSLQHYVERGMTQQEIAVKIDKSQGYVAQALATAKLPEEIQEAIITRVITDTHGRDLLWFQNFYQSQLIVENDERLKEILCSACRKAVSEKMSSRESHEYLANYKEGIISLRCGTTGIFRNTDADKARKLCIEMGIRPFDIKKEQDFKDMGWLSIRQGWAKRDEEEMKREGGIQMMVEIEE